MPLQLILTAALFTTTALARVDEPTPLCDATRLGNNESFDTIATLQNKIIDSNCPNPGRMRTLCAYIDNKAKDTTPNSNYTYFFQRVVYEAACVDYANDSDEEIAQKVKKMWEKYGESQRCGPMGIPATGSPLRYAVHTMFNEFITEALSVWELDLNKIEDGMTMLDFIDERIAKASGVLKQDLERYRKSFLEMGAKKSSQL